MRRILRVFFGFLLIAAGLLLALPGVPGPGLLLALGGLVLLSEHFHWARRVLQWAKTKVSQARQKARRPDGPSSA